MEERKWKYGRRKADYRVVVALGSNFYPPWVENLFSGEPTHEVSLTHRILIVPFNYLG